MNTHNDHHCSPFHKLLYTTYLVHFSYKCLHCDKIYFDYLPTYLHVAEEQKSQGKEDLPPNAAFILEIKITSHQDSPPNGLEADSICAALLPWSQQHMYRYLPAQYIPIQEGGLSLSKKSLHIRCGDKCSAIHGICYVALA